MPDGKVTTQVMVCDACRATFPMPLYLRVIDEHGERMISACPECKAHGPRFKEPGMGIKFRITVEQVKDED